MPEYLEKAQITSQLPAQQRGWIGEHLAEKELVPSWSTNAVGLDACDVLVMALIVVSPVPFQGVQASVRSWEDLLPVMLLLACAGLGSGQRQLHEQEGLQACAGLGHTVLPLGTAARCFPEQACMPRDAHYTCLLVCKRIHTHATRVNCPCLRLGTSGSSSVYEYCLSFSS